MKFRIEMKTIILILMLVTTGVVFGQESSIYNSNGKLKIDSTYSQWFVIKKILLSGNFAPISKFSNDIFIFLCVRVDAEPFNKCF